MSFRTSGELTVTVEFAKDLQNKEWIGRQDPYAVVRVGSQSFRTKTATDGGTNPVWDQSFIFSNVEDVNELEIDVKDDELLRDEPLGTAVCDLSRIRSAGSERLELPVVSRSSGRQNGFVGVTLRWRPAPGAAFPAGAEAYGVASHGIPHGGGGGAHGGGVVYGGSDVYGGGGEFDGGRKVFGEEHRVHHHQQQQQEQFQNFQQQPQHPQHHHHGPLMEVEEVAILERPEQRW